MTAAGAPDRAGLARMFLTMCRPPGRAIMCTKNALHQYVTLAEDTITLQGQMMRGDADDLAAVTAGNARLAKQNATLRTLIEVAITAGLRDDHEAIATIRQALKDSE